ncbi:MAG TPA: hypothetical protein VGZ25_06760 [Gemmataceae bacterium]|nr:hypothetical protein [Gemmataceae bacterium]
MRPRRLWQIVLGILASVLAFLAYAAFPGKSTFTVSPETTYVTGPLDKKGHVDYVSALNERLGKDIKPENNANVLIWQALWPHPEGGTLPPEYFQWLGIESPPEKGDYLVGWQDYAKEHLKIHQENGRDPWLDRMQKAASWPWTAKENPELADWLMLNEKPLTVLMEATRRPEYFNPLVPNRTEDWSPGLIGALLPQVQKCRELATTLTCRAMLRIAEGKTEEAWHDLLACHRLGRLIARGGSLIEMLVGIAIDQVASKADLAFLDHASLTPKQALAYLEDLQKIPPMPALADKMDLGERFMLLDGMMSASHQGVSVFDDPSRLIEGRPPSDQSKARLFTFNVNWDPALRNANAWLDRWVAALQIKDRQARMQELASIAEDLRTLKQEVANLDGIGKALTGPTGRGEMIGNIVIVMMLPAFEKIQVAADRCEQTQRNLHLAFALAAYKIDQGHYPAKLDELAPKYIDGIPDDIFSGNPLIYRPVDKGYLLYSVGPNGKDDDGRSLEDEPRGDDIIVRMPVPEPRVKE